MVISSPMIDNIFFFLDGSDFTSDAVNRKVSILSLLFPFTNL